MTHASMTDEQRAFEAARTGDAGALASLLDAHPDLLRVRDEPYAMTLLHAGARYLPVVDLLLERGLEPDLRDRGDNTTAMHWAAAAGALDVVRRLADAGVDVVGKGDDHALEVIGWATCWDGCDDAAHREVADFLITRGASHHIYSAIALGLGDELRRIVARDPAALAQRMSRNEANQLPLHFAVRMNQPAMVALLVELGADPFGVDASGYAPLAYATRADADQSVAKRMREVVRSELDSAARGKRAPHVTATDLAASLALGDWPLAEVIAAAEPSLIGSRETGARGDSLAGGLLHIMAKRGDVAALRWLLSHGADPNARWLHWDSELTALHLAILSNAIDAARVLLEAGADPLIRDTKHGADARGWASFFKRDDIAALIAERTSR